MGLIYIIEDDDNIREIEEVAVKNAGYDAFGFSYAKDFNKKIKDKIPDLCLVDVMLPDENGNDIVKKIRKDVKTKDIPIIMVTAKTTELDLMKGIDDGADDYIKKPFSVIELISKIKALLRRTQIKEENKILQLEGIKIDSQKHEASINDKVIDLTYKEYELLSLLILNKGIVLERNVIMDKIWGTDYEGESRTIDMHIKTLRKKLSKYGSRIKTVRNVGYVIK